MTLFQQLDLLKQSLGDMAITDGAWTLEMHKAGFKTVVYEDMHVVYWADGQKFTIPSYAPIANKPEVGSYCIVGSPEKFKIVKVIKVTEPVNLILANAIPEYHFIDTHRTPEYFNFPDGHNVFKDTWKRIQEGKFELPLTILSE